MTTSILGLRPLAAGMTKLPVNGGNDVELTAHLAEPQPERKASGAIVQRSFRPGGTGQIEEMVRLENGWVTYPTNEDAWYFGVWVNFRTREIIFFAEGDVTHLKCMDDSTFDAELKEMAEFHGSGRLPCAKGFGKDGVTHFYDTLFRMKCEHSVVGLLPSNPNELPIFVAVNVTADAVCKTEIDLELVLPTDVYELDLLHVSAFAQDNSLRAMRTDAGIAFILQSEGRQYAGHLV